MPPRFFFGAEFTQVYARKYGSQIVPGNAVPLTSEARAEQGIKPNENKQRAVIRYRHHLTLLVAIPALLQPKLKKKIKKVDEKKASSTLTSADLKAGG